MQVRGVLDCAADFTAQTMQQAALRGDRATSKKSLEAARRIYRETQQP